MFEKVVSSSDSVVEFKKVEQKSRGQMCNRDGAVLRGLASRDCMAKGFWFCSLHYFGVRDARR